MISKAAHADLLVTFHVSAGRDSDEGICPGTVGERARQKRTGEKPPESIALLLKHHQHSVHRLDANQIST